MSVLALIRPDDWNFALFVHVLGAFALLGTLALAVCAMFLAWRDGSAALVRLGYRSLVLGVLPSWIVMRGGGEWIVSKEKLEDADLAWLDIGFSSADGGFALLVIAAVLAGIAVRRGARDRRPALVGGSAVIALALLVLYLVALWAMSAKPT